MAAVQVGQRLQQRRGPVVSTDGVHL